MENNQATDEKRQPGKAGKVKKQYRKPAFRYEQVFETLALSCGKTSSNQGQCQGFGAKSS